MRGRPFAWGRLVAIKAGKLEDSGSICANAGSVSDEFEGEVSVSEAIAFCLGALGLAAIKPTRTPMVMPVAAEKLNQSTLKQTNLTSLIHFIRIPLTINSFLLRLNIHDAMH